MRMLLRWGFEPGFLLLITAPLQCVMLAARGLGQMEGVRSRVSRCLPETSDSVSQGEPFWLHRALLREGLITPLTSWFLLCWGLNTGPQTWEVSALPWSCIFSSGYFFFVICVFPQSMGTIHGLRIDGNERCDG